MDNKNFLRNFLVVIIVFLAALYLIKAFDISYPLTIVSTTKSTELAVVGEGKVEVTPDTAYVNAGITVDNQANVSEVQTIINTVNNKIIDGLGKLEIKKADIKTSNYSISPNYKYENNSNSISGYNGNATVQVKVRNTQLVSQVIEAVTSAGANQIQGVSFSIDNPDIYREEARDKAIANAKDQAEKMAKNLGINLGKITNIVESSPEQPVALTNTAYSAEIGGGPVAPVVEPGSQTVSSVVTLYFEKR